MAFFVQEIRGHAVKKSHDYPDAIVLGKLRFLDGMMLSVGLTVEIELRSQISPVLCGQRLRGLTET